MKKSIILCILGMGLFYPVKAQILKGRILEQDAPAKSPLVGAHIFWAGTATGTFSDASGNFELKRNPRSNRLIISFIGFESDTLENPGADFIEVFLKPAALLETVEVQDKGLDVDPIQSELITVKDLAKAACCNLSESFETNASIDVSATDAVSGTKRLRLLGLDGIYAQIMSENVPSVRGLASRT
ncbi:MAG: carboxypeptidase-like regulatory domain-containing protein, partial [Bacteroidota bacterium]